MLKNLTKLTLTIILFSYFSNAYSQVTYAKPEEIKILKKRTLIVEQLEIDNDYIASLTKKISKQKKMDKKKRLTTELSDYKNFINDFNINIKATAEKYFDLNEKVEFKTTTEIEKIMKAKSTKYTVLFYSESSSNKSDAYGKKYFPNLSIPTLNYSRSEKGTIKVDYSFFMPYTGLRTENRIKKEDFILSFILMKNHILEIEKTGIKKYTFKKYVEAQGKKNTSSLKGQSLNIIEDQIHKNSTIREINSAYKGDVNAISEEEYNNIISNQDDKIIGVIIAYNIIVGSMGPISSARITSLKTFINIKTGKIYTCIGTSTGETNDEFYRTNQFKKY